MRTHAGTTWTAVPQKREFRPFSFVTIKDPKDIKDRNIQHRIRRHAGLKGARERSKKPRPIIWEFELKAVEKSTKSTAALEGDELSDSFLTNERTSKPVSLKSHALGHASPVKLRDPHNEQQLLLSDPYAMISPLSGFAVPPDERSILLFDFFLDYKSRCTYPFAPLCFSFALWDEAVVSLVLASASSLYMEQTGRSKDTNVESTTYLAAGLRSINSRLGDPVGSTSDAVVCALVALACQGLFEGKFSGWKMHMGGLREIVRLRGGPDSLSSVDMLGQALLLVDMNGALALDAKPFFHIPRYLPDQNQAHYAAPVLETLVQALRLFPDIRINPICDALRSVASLSHYVNEHASVDGFFKDDNIRASKFLPVLGKVLHLDRPDQALNKMSTSVGIMKEAIRLTLLVYVAMLKECFCIAPNCVEDRSSQLRQFLMRYSTVDQDPQLLCMWLWIYAIVTVSEDDRNDGWVIARISSLMEQMSIPSWSDAASTIRSIAWVDQMGTGSLAVLGLDVQRYRSRQMVLQTDTGH